MEIIISTATRFFSRSEVSEYSPQKNLEKLATKLPAGFPCLMAIGEYESDEFKRQGDEFHEVGIYK